MDVLKKTGTVHVMFEIKTRARKLHLRAVVAGMRMVPTAHVFPYLLSSWCTVEGELGGVGSCWGSSVTRCGL